MYVAPCGADELIDEVMMVVEVEGRFHLTAFVTTSEMPLILNQKQDRDSLGYARRTYALYGSSVYLLFMA